MTENWENSWKDYYEILQVHPKAGQDVITVAYQKLAKKYHPDVNKNVSAPERMTDINEAFSVLVDPEKRKQYHKMWVSITSRDNDTESTKPSLLPQMESKKNQPQTPGGFKNKNKAPKRKRSLIFWVLGAVGVVILGVVLAFAFVLPKGAAAKSGDTVKVDYTLTLPDGTVYDTSEGREPLEFTLGKNQVIVGFEKAVIGMRVRESKEVTIPVDEAYGRYRDDLITKVNRSDLPQTMIPKVGGKLRASSPDGTYMDYPIIAVDDTTVTVDANHPLADKDLTFKVRLVEIVRK